MLAPSTSRAVEPHAADELAVVVSEMVQDKPLPWQKPQTEPTPGRVAQGFSALLAGGTPAGEPKPRGKSAGWQQGQPRTPRLRYPVVKRLRQNKTNH